MACYLKNTEQNEKNTWLMGLNVPARKALSCSLMSPFPSPCAPNAPVRVAAILAIKCPVTWAHHTQYSQGHGGVFMTPSLTHSPV